MQGTNKTTNARVLMLRQQSPFHQCLHQLDKVDEFSIPQPFSFPFCIGAKRNNYKQALTLGVVLLKAGYTKLNWCGQGYGVCGTSTEREETLALTS